MKRTNLTNFYKKFHRHRKQKNQEKHEPPVDPMEHDLDDLLEYDDEFSRTAVTDTCCHPVDTGMNQQVTDGVPLSVELAAAANTPDSQEIFLRLPSGSNKVVSEKPIDLDYDDEVDLESIYENSSKAVTPATTVPQVDDEQILFEGEKGFS